MAPKILEPYISLSLVRVIQHCLKCGDIGALCYREDLQEALCRYVTDTLSYTGTMSSFCEKVSQWVDKGKTELGKLKHETNSDSLAAVLKETLGGLEELQGFLDALEKLAVTSLHVFVENQGTRLPGGTSLEHVREVIKVARLICPLFLHFKRDAKAFFLPRLQNLEVLSYQLDEYIMNTEKIAEAFEQRYADILWTLYFVFMCVNVYSTCS